MPIQVVATFKNIPPPPVDLVTAGADLFPVCNTIITLEAIVDPIENLPDHTILWEQLSGTPVALSNTDQLITTYVQLINDETDKEFKITIDKNLPEEQSDTITVYATPTSLPLTSFPSDSDNGIASDAVIDLSVNTTAAFPDPQNVINPAVTITPQFQVFWSEPPDTLLQPYIVGYTLYENDINVATYTNTDPLVFDGGPEVYQVEAHFVVNGTAPYQSSSERGFKEDFSTANIPLVHVLDDLVESTTYSSPTVTRVIFGNVILREEDPGLETLRYTADIDVTRFNINTILREEDITYAGLANGTTDITRLDPGGIGGG